MSNESKSMKYRLINLIQNAPVMIPTSFGVICLVMFITASLGYADYYFKNEMINYTMSAFFNVANIILIFLVFLASYHSYLAMKSTRYFVLSISFLFLGCLNVFMYIYNLYGFMQSGSFGLVHVNIYVLERLIMALVIYVVAVMDSDKTTELSNKSLIFVLPIISLIFVMLIANLAVTIIPFDNLKFIVLRIEIGIGLIYLVAFYKMLRIYILNKHQKVLIMTSSLAIFVVSQVVFFVNYNFSIMDYILNSAFRMIALILVLESIMLYDANRGSTDIKTQENQLKLYADRLDVVIEKRTQKMQAETNQFISELEYAKLIQQSLLPQKKMHFKNGTIFLSEYFPCERLSGDFYDIYKIDEDNIAMYILDVSGHGISAALMTMFCNNYIKSTERLIKRYRGLKPHRNLKHFYDEFNKMNFPEEMHMVIFFASYNVVTKVLTYCSGGMNCEPIIFKKNGSFELLDKSVGFPICKLSEFFQPDFSSEKIVLEEGDKVIFYTDGLVDKLKNKIIDNEELIELFINNSSYSSKEINELLVSKINPYKDILDDDISYFIMEI
ncbi:MAG: SpoIIE family protein phosphatase [Acidaminobacteraceae bacterium]